MRLYDEIFNNVDDGIGARCIWIAGGGGYFEGVKCVEEFAKEQVVVCFSKTKVLVKGNDISIKKYCDGDLQLDGKIYALEQLGGPSETAVTKGDRHV